MATRYEPLAEFLQQQPGQRVPLTFQEVEKALGFRLPPSKRYPAWWSNNPANNPMTRVWLEAGFVTEQVDTSRERLVFRRAERGPKPNGASNGEELLARLRAALGGTVRYAPGFDATEPTGEVWDAER
jgi:hypothetical protein